MATVIFKPTESCNSRCIYCDVVHKEPRTPSTMPLETLELFFSRVNEFLVERPEEQLEIIWHGGEPLLLGPEYFYHAIRFQEKHCAGTARRIRHNIQSNLTLFNREFAGIFRKLGISSIGTSYDPAGNIRGLGSNRDSSSYNRKFMEALAIVEEEGFNWGVIYVVTRLSLARPLEIFRFLTNLSPRSSIMLNPVLLYSKRLEQLKVSPEEYADFLGAIFPLWWARRDEFPQVQPFHYLTKTLLEGGRSLMCCDSGACAHTHLNILPDGSLSHCGRSADWGLLDYGSIFDKSFSQALADPQRETLLSRNEILVDGDCNGCRFWDICHGGCPLDAWSAAGSFLHKSEWCQAKKGFIEKYLEPVVHGKEPIVPVSPPPQADQPSSEQPPGDTAVDSPAQYRQGSQEPPLWIDPIGGLGDTLMISGVLKQVTERDPSRKFNLVARTKYPPLLQGHPAIGRIGHPEPGARLIRTNYWDLEEYSLPGARAYQVLAGMFDLPTPAEERLYVPWELLDDPLLMQMIPWQERNVIICQSSESPRKQMDVERWEPLVKLLRSEGIGVVQVGQRTDPYVRGAYSLLGLTTPRQFISLLRHFQAVVTADNFLMHAAHLCATPAVVIWGPTEHETYGYAGQLHFQGERLCDSPEGCIGPRRGNIYRTACPMGEDHCTNRVDTETLYRSVLELVQRKSAGR